MHTRTASTLLIVPLLAGCGGAADPSSAGVFFPTAREEAGAVMSALYRGPLVVRDDCVLVGSSGDYTLPIWPKGFTAGRDDAGRLVVSDDEGRTVAVEGEALEMGGGYVAEFQPKSTVAPREEQIQWVEEELGSPIPERCLGADVYGVWRVGETEPR